jgi:hypothetical protein
LTTIDLTSSHFFYLKNTKNTEGPLSKISQPLIRLSYKVKKMRKSNLF